MYVADGFGGAFWMAYFANWSLYLTCVSAGLGVLVSLKYLVTSHHVSRIIVHGRPGLTPRHRESQYACGCLTSASDLEHGILPDQPQTALTARDSSSHALVESPWVMHVPRLEDSASIARGTFGPKHHTGSQPASASLSTPKSESAFVQPRRLARTPSDLESMAPAELRYAPQVALPTQTQLDMLLNCSRCVVISHAELCLQDRLHGSTHCICHASSLSKPVVSHNHSSAQKQHDSERKP